MDRRSNPSAALGAELAVLERQIDDTANVGQDLVAHDARFHDMILASAGNPVIQQAYVQTHCHLHVFRLYPAHLEGRVTLREHRSIRDAIADADPAASAGAMSAHIRNSYKRFARAFEADPTDVSEALRGRMIACSGGRRRPQLTLRLGPSRGPCGLMNRSRPGGPL